MEIEVLKVKLNVVIKPSKRDAGLHLLSAQFILLKY